MKISSMFSLLLTYLLFLLIVFLLQRKLMYFPEQFTTEQHQQILSQFKLKPWPEYGTYRGLISQTSSSNSKGTILIFHGNAGSAVRRGYYIDALQKLGYRVIIAEYPGYGSRAGEASEHEFIKDGIETARLALNDFNGPLFLWGESLGAGVVSGIIQAQPLAIKGIALVTPFDSMANVAQHHYWYFLGKWLTRDKYDNIKNLQGYAGKAAIIMAAQDQIVPNKYTLNLYSALAQKKQLWTFKEAGHNTLPFNPDQPWWREVMQFLDP